MMQQQAIENLLAILQKINLSQEELKQLSEFVKGYSMVSNIDNIITNFLIHQLTLNPSFKGFQYIKDAIIYILDDPRYLNSFSRFLYPAIARKNTTTSTRVERAIRHTIERSWERITEENRIEIFDKTMDKKPSNKKYLSYVTNYIRAMYQQQIEKEYNISSKNSFTKRIK